MAELGSPDEARSELAHISAERLDHPDVLEVSWMLFAREKNWNACVKTADLLVQQAPERPGGWIHRSFALHELDRTEEAYSKLNPFAGYFRSMDHPVQSGLLSDSARSHQGSRTRIACRHAD